jgi:hypothetical protein
MLLSCKIRLIILVGCLMFSFTLDQGREFQPNWESLDRRLTLSWFHDAKFDILKKGL